MTVCLLCVFRSSQGTLARDLLENGGNGRKIELDVRRRVELEGAELEEYMRSSEGERHKSSKLIKQDIDDTSSDSEDELEMNIITGKHDIVVRNESMAHSGFFKTSRKQHVMFPFHEEKIKSDEYGEIIQLEDYKMLDVGIDVVMDDNKENAQVKVEDIKKETDKGKTGKLNSSKIAVDVRVNIFFFCFYSRLHFG